MEFRLQSVSAFFQGYPLKNLGKAFGREILAWEQCDDRQIAFLRQSSPKIGSNSHQVGSRTLPLRHSQCPSALFQGHPAGNFPWNSFPLEKFLVRVQPLPVPGLLPGGAALHPALPIPAAPHPPLAAPHWILPVPLDRGGDPPTENPRISLRVWDGGFILDSDPEMEDSSLTRIPG